MDKKEWIRCPWLAILDSELWGQSRAKLLSASGIVFFRYISVRNDIKTVKLSNATVSIHENKKKKIKIAQGPAVILEFLGNKSFIKVIPEMDSTGIFYQEMIWNFLGHVTEHHLHKNVIFHKVFWQPSWILRAKLMFEMDLMGSF